MNITRTPEQFGRGLPVPRGVAEHVRGLIERERMQPGDRLPSERTLADRLRVSRASIREALSTLETLGTVTIQPGRGAFVAEPRQPENPAWRFGDLASPRDVYEARICVEGFAAGLAAERFGELELARLRESVAALRDGFELGDIEAMAGADSAFHDLIIEVGANPLLTVMYRSVREMMVATQKLPMMSHSRLDDTVAEHEALLAAFEARDAERASQLMTRHIRSAASRFGIAI